MQAKSPCWGGCKHPPQQTPLWQKAAAILVWILIWQLAAMGLGHGGLFLATPLQTLGALVQLAPTAVFWQRIVFSALRIMAGFLLAAAGGLLLGAAGARWHWVRVFIDPAMQLIRAMPVASFVILALLWVRSANLSVIGLPDHSVGDALYRAKITLSTPDVFAWTLVIVLLSAALSAAAAALLRTAKTRLCGEVRV